jgi:hypothetical protein
MRILLGRETTHFHIDSLTHWHLMECSTTNSYSSYDVVSELLDVDIESVDFDDVVVAVAVAVDQDNVVIRYESWKFVIADYELEGESEGFGCLN